MKSVSLPEQIWAETCQRMCKRVGVDVTERWIVEGVMEEMGPLGTLEIRYPSSVYVTWIETYYQKDLEHVLSRTLGEPVKVKLAVADDPPANGRDSPRMAAPAASGRTSRARIGKSHDLILERNSRSAGLNPKYSFDTFVAGESNESCHATAKAVVETPGARYNPVLFCGGSGLGKTHLMSAIGHAVLRQHPKKKVRYTTAEQFTNEFIEAVQSNRLTTFRRLYRTVDVLLIDDLQFVAGKDATQEEFFHTFNTLINSHSQLVMTCDRPVSEVPHLKTRLISRCDWGLTAEILPPGQETRLAILRQKMRDWRIEIAPDILDFIAARIGRNVRRLEGALLRISSHASLFGKEISLAEVEDYLRDLLDEENARPVVTIDDVKDAVASYYEIPVRDLKGRSRTAAMVRPRQIAMYLSRELTQASLKEIGGAFEREHVTIIQASRKIQKALESNRELRRTLTFLRDRLGQ